MTKVVPAWAPAYETFDSGSPRNADEISASSFNLSKSLALNTAPLFRNARSHSACTSGAL